VENSEEKLKILRGINRDQQEDFNQSNSEANLRDKRQKLAGNHDAGKWFYYV